MMRLTSIGYLKARNPPISQCVGHIYESYFDSQNNSVHPWSLRDEIAGGIADLRLRKAGKPT